MLDHFEPNGSHVDVFMTLLSEIYPASQRPIEDNDCHEESTDPSVAAPTLQGSGLRSGYGLLDDWRSGLTGFVTRWMGRGEQRGIDPCYSPSTGSEY